jgi:hypothetical protein
MVSSQIGRYYTKMSADRDPEQAAILIEIAAEIHRFIQAFPNNYAARALANLVNREAAGEPVDEDERELVLLTLLREAMTQARGRPFSAE